MGTLDPSIVTEIERIRKTPTVEVDMSIMASDEQKRCIFFLQFASICLEESSIGAFEIREGLQWV